MKNNILPFSIGLLCIIGALALVNYSQLQEIDALKEKIKYQDNYIEDINNNVLKPLGIDEN